MTAKAALALLIALAVLALAVSLVRRRDWRGLVVGGFFVGAGLLSWTFSERPTLVWALLAAEGVVFAIWSWPWITRLRAATRLGTAWLGVSYWLFGIVGALLVAHWQIAAERLAYAGVFGLAVLAVLARGTLRDLSAGVATAFVFALGALLLAGAGNLFEAKHVVPATGWGFAAEHRFWGGEYLLLQPNSMAALAAIAAVRVGLDRGYAAWQRAAVTLLAGLIVYVTNSRTGFVILAVAAVAHAVLLWWRRGADLPSYGTRWRAIAAATVPFLVLVAIGGASLLGSSVPQERYEKGGVTSGRVDTWKQVAVEWRDAGVAEKLFGDASSTRATITRPGPGADVKLTTDNAAIGALRRGGVLGIMGFVLGLALLVWHAWRRTAPAWFLVAVAASLPPIATSDALLGGTGGTIWVLLLTGEAWTLRDGDSRS